MTVSSSEYQRESQEDQQRATMSDRLVKQTSKTSMSESNCRSSARNIEIITLEESPERDLPHQRGDPAHEDDDDADCEIEQDSDSDNDARRQF